MTGATPGASLRARIFLVGVPRSGTTLLQALLAAHPAVTSFTESHFFSRHFRPVTGLGTVLTTDPGPRVAEFIAENGVEAPAAAGWFGPPRPAVLRWGVLRPFGTRAVARRLVRVLDELAEARGAAIWLEKTPRHLQRLDVIRQACDDGIPTHVVHIVRDGLQTVASLHHASRNWERPYDLRECVDRWNRDLELSFRVSDAPGHHVVTYESLTGDPQAVLRPLLDRLGLAWKATLLEDFGRTADPLRAPGEHWKQDVARPIRPSATADERLTAEQRDEALATLDRALYDRLAGRSVGGRSDA